MSDFYNKREISDWENELDSKKREERFQRSNIKNKRDKNREFNTKQKSKKRKYR